MGFERTVGDAGEAYSFAMLFTFLIPAMCPGAFYNTNTYEYYF